MASVVVQGDQPISESEVMPESKLPRLRGRAVGRAGPRVRDSRPGARVVGHPDEPGKRPLGP